MPGEYPELEFSDQPAWESWLQESHQTADGVWLRFAKKGSGQTTVNYAEALDVALCYGWIDGHAKRLDDDYYLQKFTPRRKRSRWSKINTEHVARLVEEGRMRPAGQAQVDLAKADGRWDAAYASPAKATVPDDLQAALEADPRAASHFNMLSSANRYSILYNLHDAKKPETRERRLKKYLAMLREDRGPHD